MHTGCGNHPASCTVATESFYGAKWQKLRVNHSSPLALKLKKEWSYKLLPWCFVFCDWANFTFYHHRYCNVVYLQLTPQTQHHISVGLNLQQQGLENFKPHIIVLPRGFFFFYFSINYLSFYSVACRSSLLSLLGPLQFKVTRASVLRHFVIRTMIVCSLTIIPAIILHLLQ